MFRRTFVQPANPETTFQEEVRSDFSAASKQFSTLTPALQIPWTTLGNGHVRNDPNGDAYSLSAKEIYVAVNCLRQQDAQAITDTAPAGVFIDGPTDYTAPTIAVGGATISFDLTHGAFAIGGIWAVKFSKILAGNALQPTENDFAYATTDFANSFVVVAASPQTIVLNTADLKIPLAAGDRIGVQVQGLSDEYNPNNKTSEVNVVVQAT